ncbi:ABC transporter permease [Ornithinimicrobium sp. Arc0846-15]|nr:ABC transporter permease [Ornithinimicrobium laminariae]
MSEARPASTRVLAQAQFEARNLLANGEQLLVSLLLPLLALVGLSLSDLVPVSVGPWEQVSRINVVVPGVLALAVVSTALTGQAILLGYERRYGVLRLLGTTPLGRGGLIMAKAGAVFIVVTLQVLVISGAGVVLGWRPDLAGMLPALLFVVLGSGCFVALAVVVGGALRAEAVLALANLLWVVLLAGGGILIPTDALPASIAAVIEWLPSALLADGLRSALTTSQAGIPMSLALLALIAWTLLLALAARRLLRWSD